MGVSHPLGIFWNKIVKEENFPTAQNLGASSPLLRRHWGYASNLLLLRHYSTNIRSVSWNIVAEAAVIHLRLQCDTRGINKAHT